MHRLSPCRRIVIRTLYTPVPDDADAEHPKVRELRDKVMACEGMVWCSPERHGAMTEIMKAQIDWIPLSLAAQLNRRKPERDRTSG